MGFVENSEAERHVFVVVVIGDVMIACRRYHTFVLAWSGRKGGRGNEMTAPPSAVGGCAEPEDYFFSSVK